jgi:hypothetical protein
MTSYFALAPTTEIAKEINRKFEEHLTWLRDSGYAASVQTMYDLYYGLHDGGFDLEISQDGSTAKVNVNHFKSCIQRLVSVATQSKVEYVPRARNTDADSMSQAHLSKGLLESIADDKNLDAVNYTMVETGVVCLDAFVYCPWDETQGELVRVDEETLREIKTGDQEYHNLTYFNVARQRKVKKSSWYIVELPVNKWDLAATYPEHAEEILKTNNKEDGLTRLHTPYSKNGNSSQADIEDDDVVFVRHFLHDRTPALRDGRLTIVCGDIVLKDIVFPYKSMPITHFSASKIIGANEVGDSQATMLVSLQRVYNEVMSSNVSNNLHYNKQSIYSSTPIEIQPLSEGFNNIISASEPKALQLTASAPESYKLLEGIAGNIQTLSGMNATARGNPEASLKSGNSLALMLSVAVMSADSIQKNYVPAASEIATITIHNFQTFATEERVAYIGGISKKAEAKTFTNKDIEAVDRISIDLGNPLLSNLGGRYELTQQFLQFGAEKNPAKLIEFLSTGQMESFTEDDFSDIILIRTENEAIRRGEVPPVVLFDMHPEHILEHRKIASDLDVRKDPKVMQALLSHIQNHIATVKVIDPDLAAILNIPPLPSQQAALMPPSPPPPGADGPSISDEPPEIMDENLPSLPAGTPQEAQQAYEEATQQLPDMNQDETLVN